MKKEHRWSGWPGAFCLYCLMDDPEEYAMANDWLDIDEKGNNIWKNHGIQKAVEDQMICPASEEHRKKVDEEMAHPKKHEME